MLEPLEDYKLALCCRQNWLSQQAHWEGARRAGDVEAQWDICLCSLPQDCCPVRLRGPSSSQSLKLGGCQSTPCPPPRVQ